MKNKRLTELDGLRGIAALAVVLFHYIYHYDNIYGHSFAVSELFRFGYYGVHLFFIVSGFVIYWTISKSKNSFDFIWSRFSRLYPVFWAALSITFLSLLFFSLPGREKEIGTFLMNITMVHEYFNYSHIDGVYWTLTLELAFYFWICLIFYLGKLDEIEKILIFWVITATILTFETLGLNIDKRIGKFFLLDYIELFSAGICFYKYKTSSYTNWTNTLLLVSSIALFLSYPLITALGLFSFFIIFLLVVTNRVPILGNRFIVYVGTVSYSLYLIHQNIGYLIIHGFYKANFNPIFGIAVALLVSFTLAHLLTNLVEQPSLKALRRISH
ncbi:acyltransferase [Paraglaciecola chathamensis]|uniref:acyltransferase family protein n=1 Tax=Paraglaciecola chathamensis TaxID=368405 RepID=UPI00270D356F|nr:acyltransferase [Paraglaciecola chathamensis]MDO6839798.1 acyltransferase [Paraglaciecola chathamensis]